MKQRKSVAMLLSFFLIASSSCHAWSPLSGMGNVGSFVTDHDTRHPGRATVTTALHMTAMALSANSTQADVDWTSESQIPTVSRKTRTRNKVSSPTIAVQRWNQRFEELVTFRSKHGQCEPVGLEHKNLTTWMRNQRMQYVYHHQPSKKHLSFLTPGRIQRLEAIGFIWNVHDANWTGKFHELRNFKERFGHCNVPTRWEENPSLSGWVSFQRHKYNTPHSSGRINEEHLQLLNSIQFSWCPKRETWWTMYHDLIEYKKIHGDYLVPQRYPDNPPLGIWVRHLRRNCREYVLSVSVEKTTEGVFVSGLDEERLQAVRDLKFCWLPDPLSPLTPPPEDIFSYFTNAGS